MSSFSLNRFDILKEVHMYTEGECLCSILSCELSNENVEIRRDYDKKE